jgi:hypothetical protein
MKLRNALRENPAVVVAVVVVVVVAVAADHAAGKARSFHGRRDHWFNDCGGSPRG